MTGCVEIFITMVRVLLMLKKNPYIIFLGVEIPEVQVFLYCTVGSFVQKYIIFLCELDKITRLTMVDWSKFIFLRVFLYPHFAISWVQIACLKA